ncbi:FAD-dependent monooxygenase [Actinoallomurus sp. NPDC052274]|uniref:FAD-dependent monooxygenase n=1 Tax=Actinoallomurus sp. NPDC052274 TaxID=3155420 RepID=UPI0034401AA5
MPDDQTSVLIVGGGLTGLSAAVFLRVHGVPVTLVERHRGVLLHPRARTVNPRTLELFHQAGLAEAIVAGRNRAAGELMITAETLTGRERVRRGAEAPDGEHLISPCPWTPIDQDRLEVLLRAHAEKLGANLRFGVELTSFEQDDDGVVASVRDAAGGPAGVVRASYLIAADGCGSPVRRRLGIGRPGPGLLGSTMTLVFDADLDEHVRGRSIAVCHVDHPAPGTVLLPHDGRGRWVFSTPWEPARPGGSADTDGPIDLDDERALLLIRAAVGDPGLRARVVPQLDDGTRFLRYDIEAFVAERFRAGRVFLAGDAAHAMPPVGALGSGTGIQDAHNLAWKLAAVLAGRAGPALLDTYEAERGPVAEFTLRQALLLMRDRTGRDVLGTDEPAAAYDSVVFGYRYPAPGGETAVHGAGGPVPAAVAPEELTGLPGTRAPHVTIRYEGRVCSTLDLYGSDAVLIAGPEGAEWAAATTAAAERLGTPLRVHRLGADLDDPDQWCRRHRVGPAGAVLVRPDGFVAWRAADGPAGVDPDTAVADALSGLWCLA